MLIIIKSTGHEAPQWSKLAKIENRHPPDTQTLSGLYPIKKGVINSYPTHKRLITKSYPNCIHIYYQGGADSLWNRYHTFMDIAWISLGYRSDIGGGGDSLLAQDN